MQNQIVQPLETVGGEELLEMQLPPKEVMARTAQFALRSFVA